MISVIIPVYNAAKFILATLASVVNQEVQIPIEVIIVDDGSTDNSENIITNYIETNKLDNFRYIKKTNGGRASAVNLGVSVSKYDYIAFLDADDLWEPDKLKLQIEIAGPQKVIYCAYSYINEKGERLDSVPQRPRFSGRDKQILLSEGNLIMGSNSAVLMFKADLLKINGVDESMQRCEDWDLWIRLCDTCEYLFIEKDLVKIRRHGENQVSDVSKILYYDIKVLSKNGAASQSYYNLLKRYPVFLGLKMMKQLGCYHEVKDIFVKILLWKIKTRIFGLILKWWRKIRC